jgi:hypothetical protein
VDCELLLIVPFLFYFSFFQGLHVLGFFDQSYDFSRKSLSKYLMDTIDFNKHDINIFLNLAKIVRYGRHWDESCNEWRYDTINYIYLNSNFSNAKLCPYDDYKNYVHFKYCGILSTCHNNKKILSMIEFFVQVRSLRNQNKNSIIRWLACNM